MRERVLTIFRQTPVILVSPHFENDFINEISLEIADQLNCSVIVNNGFEKTNLCDPINSKANCNLIDHCKQELVKEEFFDPFLKFCEKSLDGEKLKTIWNSFWGKEYSNPNPTIHVFHIHGCDDSICNSLNEDIYAIIGHGKGIKADSLTCESWRKDLFCQILKGLTKHKILEGESGSKYAARDANCINQYFRKHKLIREIQSMQITIPLFQRKKVIETADTLSECISKYILFKNESEVINYNRIISN